MSIYFNLKKIVKEECTSVYFWFKCIGWKVSSRWAIWDSLRSLVEKADTARGRLVNSLRSQIPSLTCPTWPFFCYSLLRTAEGCSRGQFLFMADIRVACLFPSQPCAAVARLSRAHCAIAECPCPCPCRAWVAANCGGSRDRAPSQPRTDARATAPPPPPLTGMTALRGLTVRPMCVEPPAEALRCGTNAPTRAQAGATAHPRTRMRGGAIAIATQQRTTRRPSVAHHHRHHAARRGATNKCRAAGSAASGGDGMSTSTAARRKAAVLGALAADAATMGLHWWGSAVACHDGRCGGGVRKLVVLKR